MKLADKDRRVLDRALELRRRFDCGIFPTGSQHSRFSKLERAGLLAYVGQGRDFDGEIERDVAVYMITLAGENALDVERTLAMNPDAGEIGP